MQAAPTVPRIVFAPFELDLASGQLLRDRAPVAIAPKAFAVLRYLAERPGRLVGKQELLDHVWPKVYVSEHVLKVQIAELRKTLCDTCRESRFIQTAHRRGYRFVANTEQSIGCAAEKIPATRYA